MSQVHWDKSKRVPSFCLIVLPQWRPFWIPLTLQATLWMASRCSMLALPQAWASFLSLIPLFSLHILLLHIEVTIPFSNLSWRFWFLCSSALFTLEAPQTLYPTYPEFLDHQYQVQSTTKVKFVAQSVLPLWFCLECYQESLPPMFYFKAEVSPCMFPSLPLIFHKQSISQLFQLWKSFIAILAWAQLDSGDILQGFTVLVVSFLQEIRRKDLLSYVKPGTSLFPYAINNVTCSLSQDWKLCQCEL